MKNFFSILIYVSLISLMACVNDTKPSTDAPVSTENPSSQLAATESPAQVQSAQQTQSNQTAQVEKPAARPQATPAQQTARIQNTKPASTVSKTQLQETTQNAPQSQPQSAQPPQGETMTGKHLNPNLRKKVARLTGMSEAEIANLNPHEIEQAMQAFQMKRQKEANAAQATTQSAPQKAEEPENENALPSTCGLVSPEFIAKMIGVPADPIVVKDGSAKNSNYQRACFFKWAYNNVPNSGVMVQLSSNPVPDDLPDWASYYISTKKNNGDKAPDGSATYRYKDFPDVGVAGAYNYDLGRYYFRTDQDHVIGVLFNLQASEAEQLLWATKIGKEVLKNLY